MAENQENIDKLVKRLEDVLRKQEDFVREINDLREELNLLKSSGIAEETVVPEIEKAPATPVQPVKEGPIQERPEIVPVEKSTVEKSVDRVKEFINRPPSVSSKSNFEKFIGENLINKIGIVVTVIGVGIGAKYSIDNNLIGPLTRIVLGYLVGAALLGFGIKLKEKYHAYSAVLVSGAMAIMYFITYAAYDFYELMPQAVAFALMVLFTAFTVVAAMNYNLQVIAVIGLVGAYAVPLLLSDGSGRVAVLFSYMTIINIGILIIAFKKYWKALYYLSFVLTWITYMAWMFDSYSVSDHFWLAFSFLLVFFAIFYTLFLAYKLLRNEKYHLFDVMVLLTNSFIFFGVGMGLLADHEYGSELLGLFTLCNAVLHFVVGYVIYRKELADRNLFFLIIGLVLVFITVAIPVQLDGNWVTILWAGEAALLFWIGRTKDVRIYEKMAFPLMALACISMVQDWETAYTAYSYGFPENRVVPVFNIGFLTSALFTASFGFIAYLSYSNKFKSPFGEQEHFWKTVYWVIPVIFLTGLYLSFSVELSIYWDQRYEDSFLQLPDTEDNWYLDNFDNDMQLYRSVWMINYSLLFFTLLSVANIKKLKHEVVGMVNITLNVVVIAVFLFSGLYDLSELRDSYLDGYMAEYYPNSPFNIWVRYISLAFLGVLLAVSWRYVRSDFMKINFRMFFDLVLNISILWVLSSELVHWLDMSGTREAYKLGLSILWGGYSLVLIALGIWKGRKYLRYGAIVLFGVTLLKLFFYDIADMDTISKTIVFVSLGVLLLIISFLYNKYKNKIFDAVED